MKIRWMVGSAGLLLGSLVGCALTSKAEPTILKYYSLENPPRRPHPPGSPATGAPPLQLRIGDVNAASYIRDLVVFRDSNVEVGYFEDLRWTEKPEAYVRRDLASALFDGEQVQEIVGGVGPTLDVSIDAFEEVRDPQPVARVALSWILHDDTVVLLRDSFVVDQPLAKNTSKHPPKELALALSAAMATAIDRIVKAVVPKLAVTPSAAATPTPH